MEQKVITFLDGSFFYCSLNESKLDYTQGFVKIFSFPF